MPTIQTYPFDPTGLNPDCRVTNEQHTLTQSNYKDYHLIVPRWGPFYADGFSARFQNLSGQIRDLVFGIDYYFGHSFQSASLSTGKRLYGSVYFTDKSLTGVVVIDAYQTVGGEWNVDTTKIAEILADRLHNPLITTWEQVNDLPVYFPPTSHQWNIYDMVGMSDVVDQLGGIEDAIRTSSGGGGTIDEHINDHNNPHQVNKSQVGLGNVNNYATATPSQAAIGLSNSLYVTPAGLTAAINQQIKTDFDSHVGRTDNPHQVTAGQVGAPTIQQFNDALSLKLDKTEASTDSERFSGRTFVEATAEILSGTSANSVRMNGMNLTELQAAILSGIAANSERFAGRTPAEYDNHIIDLIGDLTVFPGTAENATQFDGRTFAAAMTEILTGTANNSTRFGGMTVAQYDDHVTDLIGELTTFPGTAENAEKFDGRTFAEAQGEILAGKSGDSSKFDGMTVAEFNTQTLDILAALPSVDINADNALMLEGQTVADILEQAALVPADDTSRFGSMTPIEFIQNHIHTQRVPVYSEKIVEISSVGYQPVGSHYVQGNISTISKPTLQKVDIFNLNSPAGNDQSCATIYVALTNGGVKPLGYSSNITVGPGSIVEEVGGAMTSTIVSVEGIDQNEYLFYIKLKAGRWMIKTHRLEGFSLPYALGNAVGVAPADYTVYPPVEGLGGSSITKKFRDLTIAASGSQSLSLSSLGIDDPTSVVLNIMVHDPLNLGRFNDGSDDISIVRDTTANTITFNNSSSDSLDIRVVFM